MGFLTFSVSPNYIITGRFTVNGSTNFANYGIATLNMVQSNASSTVCLGAGSQINLTGALANDGLNSWSAPSGEACVGYTPTSNFSLNQPLTADSDLLICEATGAGVISNVGSAVRSTGCSACNTILPVEYAYINASLKNENEINIEWVTASELNNDYFQIELSENGAEYLSMGKVKGEGTTYESTSYSESIDITNLEFPIYVRIKQFDIDGGFSTSLVMTFNDPSAGKGELSLGIFPHPGEVGNYLNLSIVTKHKEFEVQIYTTNGILYSKNNYNFTSNWSAFKQLILPSPKDKGSYLMKVVLPNKVINKYFITE